MAIYFARAGETGPVKIGYARDVSRRIQILQTAHWTGLILLRETPGGRAAESAFHRLFAHRRIGGEWFTFDDAMLSATVDAVAPVVRPVVFETARSLGFTPAQLKKWRYRGGVPHRHRLPLIEQARRLKRRLKVADLAWQPSEANRKAA